MYITLKNQLIVRVLLEIRYYITILFNYRHFYSYLFLILNRFLFPITYFQQALSFLIFL